VEQALKIANALTDDEIGASLPHLAMASAWHETQYTRLFRS
jgi:urease accessory protein